MVAPVMPQFVPEFGASVTASATQLSMSVYFLGLALGPFTIVPLSHAYGRRPVWLFCNAWYVIWTGICPLPASIGLRTAARFFSGLAGGASLTLPGPIMSEIWPKGEEAAKVYAVEAFFPYFAMAVGPIVGGLITEHLGLTWLFWVFCASEIAVCIFGLLLFEECHVPAILIKRARLLREEHDGHYYTEYDQENVTIPIRIWRSIVRPSKLFIARPVVTVMSVILAFNFGIYCIVLSTFGILWAADHPSTQERGFRYIAIAIGFTLASAAGAPLHDRIWARWQRHAKYALTPESRVVFMLPGAILMPLGLCAYGWTAARWDPPALLYVAAGVFSFGSTIFAHPVYAYLLDEMGEYSVSVGAAVSFLSNLMACVFPVFAPQLYMSFGEWPHGHGGGGSGGEPWALGWGNSVLALVFLAVAVPGLPLLWMYGAKLRAMGRAEV